MIAVPKHCFKEGKDNDPSFCKYGDEHLSWQ
jgi:hypothetical protein